MREEKPFPGYSVPCDLHQRASQRLKASWKLGRKPKNRGPVVDFESLEDGFRRLEWLSFSSKGGQYVFLRWPESVSSGRRRAGFTSRVSPSQQACSAEVHVAEIGEADQLDLQDKVGAQRTLCRYFLPG